tara:strand:- start:781 stop:1095 length:315 start_codon:yes stop_codon:yes gene_type:complete
MKVAYEFELGLILKDDKGNFEMREPLHFCPKTKMEVSHLIDHAKEYLKEKIEFDIYLIKNTTDHDWEFRVDREEISIYPNRSDAVIPKYIEKTINIVLSEMRRD